MELMQLEDTFDAAAAVGHLELLTHPSQHNTSSLELFSRREDVVHEGHTAARAEDVCPIAVAGLRHRAMVQVPCARQRSEIVCCRRLRAPEMRWALGMKGRQLDWWFWTRLRRTHATHTHGRR